MKILYGADIHNHSSNVATRRDNYPKTMLVKQEQMLEIGKEKKVDLLAIGGDFTHSPELSKLYENKLIDLYRKYSFPKACVMGNHDEYNKDPESIGKTSLGTFYKSGIFFGDQWVYETEDALLFFLPYTDSQEILEKYLNTPVTDTKNRKTILFAHYYMPGKYPEDNLPECVTHVFDYIFLGHDHDAMPPKKVNRSVIIQPGGLSRGTRNQSNWNRPVQVAYLDTDTNECEYILLKYQPAEEIFDQKRLALEKRLKETSIIDDLSKSVLLSECSDIPKILTDLNLSDELKTRVEDLLKSVGII